MPDPVDLKSVSPERVRLHFQAKESVEHVSDPIHRDLSALAVAGDALFVACDETSGVDRVTPVESGYGDHVHFELGDFFDLPDGKGGEMDVEGIDVDCGWLWVTGSQSLTRGKGSFEAMADVKWDPNRQFLGRVPLVDGEGGAAPAAEDGARRAACLKFKDGGQLRAWLRGGPRIGGFLDTPSKENGLDIEGICASGDRVWVGLRGPVLREHAVILEMTMKVTKGGWLKARKIDGDRRYRLHLIPTRGQGIRDLSRDGDDLVLLTGTTMAGDGPSQILRWRDALGCDGSGMRDVETVADMPYRGPVDHPEGLRRLANGRMLVVYDSPAADRVSDEPVWVEGDLFDL